MKDHVLVISHRRSGTHFMIDAIRNNFDKYRDKLLTLDQLIFQNPRIKVIPLHDWSAEAQIGPRVIKSHMSADIDHFYQHKANIVKFVNELLCSAKIIYVYRDGRDVLTSLYCFLRSFDPNIEGMNFHEFIRMPNDFGNTSEDVDLSFAEYWNYHVSGWIKKTTIFYISFEQLTSEYEATLKRLESFLATPLNKKFVDVTRERKITTNNKLNPVNKWKELLYKIYNKLIHKVEYTTVSFRRGKPGDYKSFFSEQDLDYFNSVAGDLMLQLEYVPSDNQ